MASITGPEPSPARAADGARPAAPAPAAPDWADGLPPGHAAGGLLPGQAAGGLLPGQAAGGLLPGQAAGSLLPVPAAGGSLPAPASGGLPPGLEELIAESARAGLDGHRSARPRRRSRTSPDRVQRSFYLPRDLVERARGAVAATMGRTGEAYNVSQLAARAIEAEVRRLELTYNGGTPFPPVSHVPPGPSPEGVERIRTGVTAPRRRSR